MPPSPLDPGQVGVCDAGVAGGEGTVEPGRSEALGTES